MENEKELQNKSLLIGGLASIGFVSGIGLAIYRKSGFWGGVGFAILGNIAGLGLGYTIASFKK